MNPIGIAGINNIPINLNRSDNSFEISDSFSFVLILLEILLL